MVNVVLSVVIENGLDLGVKIVVKMNIVKINLCC